MNILKIHFLILATTVDHQKMPFKGAIPFLTVLVVGYIVPVSEGTSDTLSTKEEKRLGYLVRCALTVKDNNVCLTDGSKGFETCTKEDNTPQCGFWEYTFQCCPETCRGKTGHHGIVMPNGNFTQKACRKLFDYSIPDIEGILGRCKYPFYSRIEDCSIQVDWEMVTNGQRCNGINEMKGEKVAELTDCAELCRKNSSKWFMYGSNDNPADPTATNFPVPEKGCDDDEEQCKCICVASSNCQRIPDD